MKNQNNKVEQELSDLYHATIPFLEEYPWEMEEDRWAVLVVCLFSGIGIDPEVAGKAVDLLKGLGMHSAKDLAILNEDENAFVKWVLLQSGIEAGEAEKATLCLLKFSRLVNNKWDGYIQRFLRSHGERMVKELQNDFIDSGLEIEQSGRIAAVWLQNVCNIPVLLSGDPHISNFCSKFKLTENELVNILDNLGLNACVADDLLAIDNNGEALDSSKIASKPKKGKKNNHLKMNPS